MTLEEALDALAEQAVALYQSNASPESVAAPALQQAFRALQDTNGDPAAARKALEYYYAEAISSLSAKAESVFNQEGK